MSILPSKTISLLTLLGAIFFCFQCNISSAHATDVPHHEITVSLDPESHRLNAVDTLTVPRDYPRQFTFSLHAGLKPVSTDPAIRLNPRSGPQGAVPLEWYSVILPGGKQTLTIKYNGTLYHPVEETGKSQARGFDQTPGTIASEGVYLAGTAAWYPQLDTNLFTFRLTVTLPAGWESVSQGGRTLHEKAERSIKAQWDSPEPQNEIYLIASRFSVSEKKGKDVTAMVFLRSPDRGLADRYLDATLRYIAMYDGLIGTYPYKKFALVENFWETGFGMPSFTLLGPTVLRLPFIINTSYPHEILHNWWGNGVYPVYDKGNWSEGITAYMADHLLKEQQGEGAEYRLTTLQKYVDYASSGRDFPLTEFTSRHSPSTEAIGYGKALMFFHMLRLELGDREFVSGIRRFYEDYKFHFATFADIEKSLKAKSSKNLKGLFQQWVTRTGAPEIKVSHVATSREGNNYTVKAVIEQTQGGPAYQLRIPVAVTVENKDQAVQTVIETIEKKKAISLAVPGRPLRLDVDPEFDIFRRLGRDEIPPAVSQALGSKKMLVVLPAAAPAGMIEGYRRFAESLSQSGPGEVELQLDRDIKTLPEDRSVTLLGWENSFLNQAIAALKPYAVSLTGESISINRNTIDRKGHSVVLTARSPKNKELSLMIVASDRTESLPGLARKLPHYHKYSYLVFEGDEPANVAKGRWPVVDSPLTAFFDGSRNERPERAKLAPRPALAALPPVYSEDRMIETVKFLSSDTLKGREIGTPQIDKAADYIADKFKQAGVAPAGDDGAYFQTWKDPSRHVMMKNVIAVIPGEKSEYAGQSVVLGAHYDHLGLGMTIGRTEDRGKIHPGADDNASGIAVLLELANALKSAHHDRTILFIAFTGEEEGKLGSHYYVTHEHEFPASKCISMVNLDTVGRLNRNKLLVLGSASAKEWVHIFRGAGFTTGVDVDMVSEDLDSSDQKSFQAAGVPAVQLFSGPNIDYHRPTDIAEKIDGQGLIKVAAVAGEVIEYLAGRKEPLTTTALSGTSKESGPKTERKVSFGAIPDFSYKGEGVRLSGAVQGSAAEAAGLKEGDVITRINSSQVTNLQNFSNILKGLKPGEKIAVTFTRDGRAKTVQSAVTER